MHLVSNQRRLKFRVSDRDSRVSIIRIVNFYCIRVEFYDRKIALECERHDTPQYSLHRATVSLVSSIVIASVLRTTNAEAQKKFDEQDSVTRVERCSV